MALPNLGKQHFSSVNPGIRATRKQMAVTLNIMILLYNNKIYNIFTIVNNNSVRCNKILKDTKIGDKRSLYFQLYNSVVIS
jgi:hypothetical protein